MEASQPAPLDHPAQPGSIECVLNDFLEEEHQRLHPPTFRKYLAIVELLESSLDGYAYETLTELERRRYDRAFEAGDERAFCHLFGPEKIPQHLGPFLYWFMLRKVIAPADLTRAAGTVTKRLVRWLEANGQIDHASAAGAYATAKAAVHDLPAAERLTSLLGDLEGANGWLGEVSVAPADIERLVEGSLLTISRVEPEALWFDGPDGELGPLDVPREAAELANPGWSLWATLAQVDGRWRLLEHGIVYPQIGYAL